MRRAEEPDEEEPDPEDEAIKRREARRPPGTRWEYKTLRADAPTASVEQLNMFGAKGWLLVTVYRLGEDWIYVFAREVIADDGAST